MNIRSFVFITFCVAALAACNSGPVTGLQPETPTTEALSGARPAPPSNIAMTDRSVLSHLSSQLSQGERRYMYVHMIHIPERYRENVIVFEVGSGRIHANKPSLVQNVRFWRGIAGAPGLMLDSRGNKLRVTEDGSNFPDLLSPRGDATPNPADACSGTGYCHTRYSDNGATPNPNSGYSGTYGFTWEDANVSFPCDSMSFPAGDAGYIYVGERDDSSADGNLAVDAGIVAQGSKSQNDQSVQGSYLLVNGLYGKSGVTYSPPSHNSHVCASSPAPQNTPPTPQTAEMIYTPTDITDVMLTVNSTYLFGSWSTVTIEADLSGTKYLALQQCYTCEVKRVTSIATSPLGDLDGSYMGVHSSGSAPTPVIAWLGAHKGYMTPTGNLVNKGWFYEFTNNHNTLGAVPTDLCIPTTKAPNPTPAPKAGSSFETVGINLVNTISQSDAYCPQ